MKSEEDQPLSHSQSNCVLGSYWSHFQITAPPPCYLLNHPHTLSFTSPPPPTRFFLFLLALHLHTSHTSCITITPPSAFFSYLFRTLSPPPPSPPLFLHQCLSHEKKMRLLTFEKILLGRTVPSAPRAEIQVNRKQLGSAGGHLLAVNEQGSTL